jgi:hypothetical protein
MFGACIDRSWRYNDLDPDVLARIRQEWRIEVKEHERTMEHAREQERQWGEKERNWESEWKEKTAEWNQKKDEWRRKEQNWDVEWNEMIRRKRAEWNHQEDEWHKKEQNLKREWNEMMRRKRKETERVEREKREREHMNLYWENIQGGDHCIAHKTKMYTARLANLLPGIDALEACRSTPLTIHGVTYYTPTNCEDRVSDVSFRS